MTFAPLGDHAVVVTLGAGVDDVVLNRVRSLVAVLENGRANGIVDVVAAYATVTVFYDPGVFNRGGGKTPYEHVCQVIGERAAKGDKGWPGLGQPERAGGDKGGLVEIPVCYGGEFGPDVAVVARQGGLKESDVVSLHAGASYVVHAVGFSPGFPYLGGLPEKLHTPRRATPRTSVPAGSVGIGGMQTGVYPLASPGGWQLIGRTPLALFDAARSPAALLRVGDRVKFKAITPEEFLSWK
ncbi:MAG: 5-oxoprolinase subunit PxpB [Verrucomicrobia bacterium]|nr:5-oxoprolinase subunit PxpB [Verrucomicrobiota bacterium]